MYLNTCRLGPSQDLKDLKPAQTVFNNLEWFIYFFQLKMLCCESCFVCGQHVGDYVLFFVPLFSLKRFFLLTYFLSVSLSPFIDEFSDELSWFVLTKSSSSVSPLLQVLKPLSEHYMEDNVRQTVVNSIKASLTEQGSQNTKLKTHWRSSSSPPPSCSSPSRPFARCAQS